MADSRIQLTSEPLSAATAALERTARLYDQVARSNERLSKAADQAESRRTQMEARAGQQQEKKALATRTRLLTGPRGRLEALRAIPTGNLTDAQRGDLEQRIGQQERALARSRRLGFSGRLATAISSTRFGAGGMSPLIGRSLDVIGPGIAAKLGPIALVAIGVTEALKAMQTAVNQTVEGLVAARSATMQTGGTPLQTAGLAAMGIEPGQQVGAAAALRERLQTNPLAMMEAGYRMPVELGGSQNLAADLQAQLAILHRMGPGEAQLTRARHLGLDSMLEQVNVSESVWREERKIAASRADLARSGQGASDLAARYRILSEQQDLIRSKIMTHLLPAGNAFLGWLNRLMDWYEEHIPGAKAAVDKTKKEAEEAKRQNSLDRNSDALDDLRSTMERQRTMTGGGERGQGIPSQLRGDELMRALVAGRYRMGAFK